MGRVALSIDDQIKRLEEKGLDLSCYETSKLKEILLDIGYYRLGFYTYYFMDDEKENFLNGIKISEIVNNSNDNKVFLICPVRNATEEQKKYIKEFVKEKNQIIMRFAGCSWNPYQRGNAGGGQRRRAFRFR